MGGWLSGLKRRTANALLLSLEPVVRIHYLPPITPMKLFHKITPLIFFVILKKLRLEISISQEKKEMVDGVYSVKVARKFVALQV